MTMNDDAAPLDRLATLARADAYRHASEAVDAAVMAAFDRHHAVRMNWRSWGAIAAALILAVGLSLTVAERYESGSRTAGSEPRAAAEVGDFVAWPGAAVLPEFEGGELVRTTLPVTVLPMLGIPPADAPVVDGHVVADVLYGQDGQPRAVRVVNQSMRP